MSTLPRNDHEIAKSAEELAARTMRRHIDQTVRELREAAGRIEALASATLSSGRNPYSALANDVQRALDVALANSPLRQMAATAAEADVLRALEE